MSFVFDAGLLPLIPRTIIRYRYFFSASRCASAQIQSDGSVAGFPIALKWFAWGSPGIFISDEAIRVARFGAPAAAAIVPRIVLYAPAQDFHRASVMNDNQEHLAFNHQIGLALSQWQNNVEFELYNIKQACSGDKRTADTYIALFTHRNFRFSLPGE